MKKKIIFNVPKLSGAEIKNIEKLSKFGHYSGNGYFTKKCSLWLKNNIKCKEALLVHSCTAALEMCAILLKIKPGDEVILPSYTFVSTANAFALRGAKLVFVDIKKNTLNIDEELIASKITKKTKAVVVVHYAGIACEIEKIKKITKKNNIVLIEDAAQAILSKFNDKNLGTFGDFATISFHETKNIHCGEGGALLINNKKYIKRAKVIRDKGTNRDEFNNKIVKKYSWVDLGSSYALSEINASFLYSQLKEANNINRTRIKIWKLYDRLFKKFEKKYKFKRPFIPNNTKINGHSYFIIIKKENRSNFLTYLKKNNIMGLFHYIPLHSSHYGKKISKQSYNLQNTDEISQSIVRMPLHLKLSEKDINFIVKKTINYFKNLKR